MPVANVPADQILNERTSYDQYLWLLIDGYYYRWDNRVEYMYTIKAVPVDGQGLPPKPPVTPIDSPFTNGEIDYLFETFPRTVNGLTPDSQGNIAISIVDAEARRVANLAVKTVNGIAPNSSGNVALPSSGSSALAYDPDTGYYSTPDGSVVSYDPASGVYSTN